MSTHRVEVIRINEILPHPHAEKLGLVRVGGYTCAVRLDEVAIGDLRAYVEPDYVIPVRLLGVDTDQRTRIKAKRLRGVWSHGVLVPAPTGAAKGDDVMAALGIERWVSQAETPSTSADAESPHPSLAHVPKYDLENWRKYRALLTDGEIVYVTEKIHGANARYAWRDGRMWCGSRTQWKRQADRDLWWMGLAQNAWIAEWCKSHDDSILYGEVYGQVQDLRYGSVAGEVRFVAFDVLTPDGWLSPAAFVDALRPEWRAPLVYVGPHDPIVMERLAEADSCCGPHMAEGVVIQPAISRDDAEIGRVKLKLVSNRYLERP